MTDQQSRFTLLAIDDDPASLELISSALDQSQIEVLTAVTPARGLEVFAQRRPAAVLVDLMMPGMNGMEVLERIVAEDPAVDVILMTAHYSSESAVEAVQKGAADYLEKPLDLSRLRQKMDVLVNEAKKRQKALQLDRESLQTFQFHGIVGRSPTMLDLFAGIRRVGPHFRTVLVTGETGTGKELVATALHKLGQNSSGRFAVCNCAAISESLVESELFGYVRGAFTGAAQDKVGLFEYADGGTVFLDEIGEMPLAAQAKLLRVLQNQEIQRVGSPLNRKINVRVIAATNRDLRREVAAKRFREDLFYRLSMVTISIPPLRKRKEDLPLLQRFLIEKFAGEYSKPIRGMTRRAQSLLARHTWPGNVRELENVIGNACMMSQAEVLDVADIQDYVGKLSVEGDGQDDLSLTLDEVQQRHISSVMKQVEGNKAQAAEMLGISRATLYSWLAKMKDSNIPAEAGD